MIPDRMPSVSVSHGSDYRDALVSDCPSRPGGLGRAAAANSRARTPNRQASATIGGRKTDAGLDGDADQGRGGAARVQEQLATGQAGGAAEKAPGAGPT